MWKLFACVLALLYAAEAGAWCLGKLAAMW